MSYVIVYFATEGYVLDPDSPKPPAGSYLQHYDPEAASGLGIAEWTTDPAKALRFDTPAEAVELYRTVPKTRPTRPDGLPNRPLMACSVDIQRLDP